MAIPTLILVFMLMLLVAVLVQPLAHRLHLPFSAVLVATGFGISELLTKGLDMDLGLRWHHFHDLVLFVFLPVLVFESALKLDLRLLWKNLAAILFLAIPMMLFSAAMTAVLVYFGIGHPGFPWIAALLTGTLLAATDPVAVVALFEKMQAPARLNILVDGESLFNDATVIVLFSLLLTVALGQMSFSSMQASQQFLFVFFGGAGVGLLVGATTLLLIRQLRGIALHGVISLITAYGAFLIAEYFLHVSGVMAVLTAGLLVGHSSRLHADENEQYFMKQLWAFNSYIANAMIFLLVGMTVTLAMFSSHWLAILIGIAAVLTARAIGIFTTVPLLGRLPGIEPIDRRYQTIMYWGGLRGAISLALALSIPTDLEYWYTIQSVAYGVVLFTLFVQAPTMPLLMNKFLPDERT